VLLNNERPGYAPLTPQWVKGRLDLFHDTTLKSLLNQSFQDFRIWAICGQNNLDVTRGYGWHERVEPMYDKGEAALAGIDTEYVAVTRIDSDDLMHRDGMGEVHDRLDFANPGRVLVFRDNLAWNRLNGYIGYYYRTSPPFFTQLYPKKQHRDWVAFRGRFYVPHGKSGGRNSDAIVLGKHKICRVRHGENFGFGKRNKKEPIMPEEWKQKRLEAGDIITCDPVEMRKILSDFGLDAYGNEAKD